MRKGQDKTRTTSPKYYHEIMKPCNHYYSTSLWEEYSYRVLFKKSTSTPYQLGVMVLKNVASRPILHAYR